MKYYRRVWIREQGFPPDLYKQIVNLKPECLEGDHFRLECQPGDDAGGELAARIAEVCEKHGLRRSGGGDIGTFGYSVVTHYEPEDLKAAPFLALEAQEKMFRGVGKTPRDSSGRLLLPASQAKPTIKVASGFLENWMVVSDAVRKLLEAGKFVGIKFVDTQLSGKSIHAASEPFWELSSDLRLPKMLNSVRHELSAEKCYFVQNPPYRNPEPRYSGKDFAALGAFDVARTFEHLYGVPELIVSQRFYQHCLRNKIPLEVLPVRIDPD